MNEKTEVNSKLGGYEVHPEVGAGELAVFEAAMKGFVGVDYKPVAVATQVVRGVNYIFVCTGKPVVPHPETKLYSVEVHVEPAGTKNASVELKEITEIKVENLI